MLDKVPASYLHQIDYKGFGLSSRGLLEGAWRGLSHITEMALDIWHWVRPESFAAQLWIPRLMAAGCRLVSMSTSRSLNPSFSAAKHWKNKGLVHSSKNRQQSATFALMALPQPAKGPGPANPGTAGLGCDRARPQVRRFRRVVKGAPCQQVLAEEDRSDRWLQVIAAAAMHGLGLGSVQDLHKAASWNLSPEQAWWQQPR